MNAVLDFQRTNEEPDKYFEIIENLTVKIFDQEWEKESLIEQLLVNSLYKKKLKLKFHLNKIKWLGNVKNKIKKLNKKHILKKRLQQWKHKNS